MGACDESLTYCTVAMFHILAVVLWHSRQPTPGQFEKGGVFGTEETTTVVDKDQYKDQGANCIACVRREKEHQSGLEHSHYCG
jgi:hypothetical protein